MNERRRASILLFLYGAIIFLISSMPGSSIPGQISPYSLLFHYTLYFLFSYPLLKFFHNMIDAYLFGSIYAASDEIHQLFVPGRSCDPLDYITDVLGLMTGMVFLILIRKHLLTEPQ